METNAHEILEVQPGAKPEEIKKAFYRLAHKHHPDHGGNAEQFKRIKKAYDELSGKQTGFEDSPGGEEYAWEFYEYQLQREKIAHKRELEEMQKRNLERGRAEQKRRHEEFMKNVHKKANEQGNQSSTTQ